MGNKKQKTFCSCEPFQSCKICADFGESENDVEKDILEYCEHLPRCKATKTSTTGRKKGRNWIKAKKSERKGKADLTLCYWGFYIEVEVKKPGEGKQKPDQIEQEKETLLALGQYWLVDNLDQFIARITDFRQTNLIFGNK
jgi:hypothetical protein